MRKFIFLLTMPFVLFTACNLSSTMLVTPAKQEVPAAGAQFTLSLTLTSEDPVWKAETDSAWITLTPERGKGDSKITVKVAANKYIKARSAVIRITDSESIVQVIVQLEGKASSGSVNGGSGGDNGGSGGDNGGSGGDNGGGGNGGSTEKGVFDVGGTKVVFAPGNLQYNPAKDEWRFAPHQYSMIGYDNDKISSTYNGYIDLFGWGTTGYMSCMPYLTTLDDMQYGPQGDHEIYEQGNTEYDWGVHIGSKIANNPNKAYKWRLLTSMEWGDIIDDYQYTLATVCGVQGLLIFPEGFKVDEKKISTEDYLHMTVNDESYLTNNGLLFLPAAGRREGSKCIRETTGWYHTSVGRGTRGCVFLEFYSERDAEQQDWGVTTCGEPYGRHIGGSVRLVREVK